jgi:crossover junction endodeoxyribonuclease RuvC
MGVGVVDSDGVGLSLAYFGVLSPGRRDPISQRLYYLYAQISSVIQEWQPSEVAIEEPFAARNIRAAMALGHAQAVAMVAAAQHGLPVSGYAPRQVKQAVTDYGGSSKEQVQEMVKVLLGLDEVPASTDASDALAVAICHINATNVSRLEFRE